MKYLRVLGARSAHRAVPGASQQGIGKCGADVVSGARLAVGSEREEIVAVPVLLQVILVDAREHEDARRLSRNRERRRTHPAPATASWAWRMALEVAPFVKYAFPRQTAATPRRLRRARRADPLPCLYGATVGGSQVD